MVGLADQAGKRADELSGGQAQRVAVRVTGQVAGVVAALLHDRVDPGLDGASLGVCAVCGDPSAFRMNSQFP